MSAEHLLLLSLGPVQEFIAQARRTRDLWYGSHLLSEMSKAAANALAECGGVQLIFPALDRGGRSLRPSEQPRTNGSPTLSVANKILARLPADCDPAAAAEQARTAAQGRLTEVANSVRSRYQKLIEPRTERSWDEQIGSLLEFAAAWAPIDDYASARDEVEARLAARKSLREFSQWAHQRKGAPKSSLDGARETVLAERRNEDAERLARRLRLSAGEQLDAVGLLKRAGGEPEQFPPLANVAMAAWIEEAATRCPEELRSLRDACVTVGAFSTIHRPDLSWAETFPFDAHLFREERWKPLFEECGLERGVDWAEAHVRPLLGSMPPPPSYVACLVADGDHMGRAIDTCKRLEDHRLFSQRLSGFAAEARRVVEGAGVRGVLVYSGGDDVMAFVCLEDALACAEALSEAFGDWMKSALPQMKEPPTLSVGLGVGHLMEEMGYLLDLGRRAEKLAKSRRNALGVIVDKRAGGLVSWLSDWNEAPVPRLRKDVELVGAKRLAWGKVFEVREMLRRMPREGDRDWARLLAHDTRRTLSRTQAGSDAVKPEEVGLQLDAVEDRPYEELLNEIGRFVDRMLVARALTEPERRPG